MEDMKLARYGALDNKEHEEMISFKMKKKRWYIDIMKNFHMNC